MITDMESVKDYTEMQLEELKKSINEDTDPVAVNRIKAIMDVLINQLNYINTSIYRR